MALTGTEIKSAILGDAKELTDVTRYDISIEDIRVSVAYNFTVTLKDAGDDGNRAYRMTVQLTKKDFDALDKSVKDAFIAAVEAKA